MRYKLTVVDKLLTLFLGLPIFILAVVLALVLSPLVWIAGALVYIASKLA